MEKIVSDYTLTKEIDPRNCKFTGNSVGYKDIVSHIFNDPAIPRSILDIGFGVGDLGRIVKSNPTTQHWSVDGIEGFYDACCNTELFNKKQYRNIWHGLAQELPTELLHNYDLICLFDVIEHIAPDAAKELLRSLLNALGSDSKLVISTPLWFWPQSQQNPDDLEEHQFGVPAQSLLLMAPTAYHINSRYLVGTFVFSRKSIDHLDNFTVITDKNFDYNLGKTHLESLGRKADDILYFITN